MSHPGSELHAAYLRGDVLATRAAMDVRSRWLDEVIAGLRALRLDTARESLNGSGTEYAERYGDLDACESCGRWMVPADPDREGLEACMACRLERGVWCCDECERWHLGPSQALCRDCEDERADTCDLAIARLRREMRAP